MNPISVFILELDTVFLFSPSVGTNQEVLCTLKLWKILTQNHYFSSGKNQLCNSTQELWPWTGRPKTTQILQFIQCLTGMTSNFKMWLGRVILARFWKLASRRMGYGWTLPSREWKVSAWTAQVSILLGWGDSLTYCWIFPLRSYTLQTKNWRGVRESCYVQLKVMFPLRVRM